MAMDGAAGLYERLAGLGGLGARHEKAPPMRGSGDDMLGCQSMGASRHPASISIRVSIISTSRL